MAKTDDTPRCAAQNRAGEPCKAHPLKGTDRCRAHPIAPDPARFGSPEQAAEAGASPKPARKLTTILLRKLEARADDVVEALLEGLEADKAVVVASGDTAEVEMVPDVPVRLRAAAEIWDRAEGKPRQALELTGEDGGPIDVAAANAEMPLEELTDEELDELDRIRKAARARLTGSD